MALESARDVKFEIGHVLFIDIVGYSKLLMHEQSEQVETLREIVRATEQFRLAETEGKLLRLPTGDGGALVFRTTPEAPVACALEITKTLKSHRGLRVRIGIHSGPVTEVTDLNEQTNIVGAGINIAQRVMDFGDAGHILLSKRIAEDLEHYARWRPLLHEVGEYEGKHGSRIAVVNLYSDEVGNPEPPKRIKADKPVGEEFAPSVPVSRKSIAVLPFENLSADPENTYFADGIQEEILMRLSRIGELKVISRTSTQCFKGFSKKLPDIAKQLGVANILEGTVQKAEDQVRLNVQLIDAENDSHLWAEGYDRKLTDIFAIESDIAAKIAEALQASLTGAERRAISSQPTKNTEAHQLYLKGRYLWMKFFAPGYERVRDYFQQAIELDPSYAPAHRGLGGYYAFGAANGIFEPEETWPKAESALNTALALDATLAEAYHLRAAVELYYKRDWPAAERNFHRGVQLDPNDAGIPDHYSLCLALFGRNEEALAQMERAAQLDPFSPGPNLDHGRLFFFLRDYNRAIKQFSETLEMHPGYAAAHEYLGDAYEKNGTLHEAITQWCAALTLSGQPEHAKVLEQTFATSGFQVAVRTLARRQLEDLDRKRLQGEYVAAAHYVFAYVRRGDLEQAFSWLPKMIDERNWFAFHVRVSPILDPLRDDPRFEKLANQIMPRDLNTNA